MIKKLITLLTILLITNTIVYAETNNSKLNQAINVINSYGYTENVKALKSFDVSVQFMSLYEVDYSYKSFYAITCDSDTDNKIYILVDSRLKNCNVNVLACLLLHESVHALSKRGKADLQEEVQAHKIERDLYLKITANNTELKNNTLDELVIRENKLSFLDDNSIITMLLNSTNYKRLLN